MIAKKAFSVWEKNDQKSTGFEEFYEKNGKKAGTYTYKGKRWSYSKQ